MCARARGCDSDIRVGCGVGAWGVPPRSHLQCCDAEALVVAEVAGLVKDRFALAVAVNDVLNAVLQHVAAVEPVMVERGVACRLHILVWVACRRV